MQSRILEVFLAATFFLVLCSTVPFSTGKPIDRRHIPGLDYHLNGDGSVSGSFANSHSFHNQILDGALGLSETFNFGPKGASISGGQTGSINGHLPGGHDFGFSLSNSNANNAGLDGFSSSGANSFTDHYNNPLFSSSNANANAYSNNFRLNNPFG